MENKSVEAGNSENWPRIAARSSPDLGTAIDNLLKQVDEHNLRFAVTEFIRERDSMREEANADS